MAHIILLGDSVFDNQKYVHPSPDVAAQLQEILPAGWKASLRAVDGAVTNDVIGQLSDLPADTTHLVLSAGGNDLLSCAGDLLQKPVAVTSEAFVILARMAGVFERMYRQLMEQCSRTGFKLVVCTIYDGCFPDQEFQTVARVAVAACNDAILRIARETAVSSIDLRLVCAREEDFANPIEPSAVGGRKIAEAIWRTISSTSVAERCG